MLLEKNDLNHRLFGLYGYIWIFFRDSAQSTWLTSGIPPSVDRQPGVIDTPQRTLVQQFIQVLSSFLKPGKFTGTNHEKV